MFAELRLQRDETALSLLYGRDRMVSSQRFRLSAEIGENRQKKAEDLVWKLAKKIWPDRSGPEKTEKSEAWRDEHAAGCFTASRIELSGRNA